MNLKFRKALVHRSVGALFIQLDCHSSVVSSEMQRSGLKLVAPVDLVDKIARQLLQLLLCNRIFSRLGKTPLGSSVKPPVWYNPLDLKAFVPPVFY